MTATPEEMREHGCCPWLFEAADEIEQLREAGRMSEHYATALVQINDTRLAPGHGWYDTKEWVILCACGEVFEPRNEQGTDSHVVTAQERIQRHIRTIVSQRGKP